MNLSVNKSDLLNSISTAIRATTTSTTQPIFACLLLTANEDGIQLTGNNLELCIQTNPIPVEALGEPGSVALDAKLFHEIVKKLPDGDVKIVVDEKNIAVIKSGKREFKIFGENAEEFPAMLEVQSKNRFTTKAAVLRNMIRQTLFTVSLDMSKPAMTGELMEVADGKINLVACDGFRIAYRYGDTETDGDSFKVVVPGKTLREIMRLLPPHEDSEIVMHFTERKILFELDNCRISSQLIEGQFIDYQKPLNVETKTTAKLNRAEFLSSLECAQLIAFENNKKTPVKLVIADDIITITANAERGTLHEETQASIEGDNLTIAFNPRLLIDALKVIDDNEVQIHFSGDKSPCVICPIDEGNYKYLVLPLRLN